MIKPLLDPKQVGALDFNNTLSKSACPYSTSFGRQAWLSGWEEAKMKAKQETEIEIENDSNNLLYEIYSMQADPDLINVLTKLLEKINENK